MTKFITGKDLEDAVYNVIWDAKEILLIVSPYIKLDNYFVKLFDKHVSNPNLHLLLVFGKNEGNASKSLGKNDFDFFKKFPNVSIIYVPNLHAKYYGNESVGVITSINLYDYSFKNNIEFGVYTESGLMDALKQSTSTDRLAWSTSREIAYGGAPVFIKRPVYQKKMLSVITGGKNYMASEVLHDYTDSFYSLSGKQPAVTKKLADFPNELDFDSKHEARPTREQFEPAGTKIAGFNPGNNKKSVSANSSSQIPETGYCIRTRTEIPFNPERPYCYDAFKSWAQWENYDFKEKYCHKTGQPSYGKTSMRHPILE